jgi:hypothetical protein
MISPLKEEKGVRLGFMKKRGGIFYTQNSFSDSKAKGRQINRKT